MSIVNKNVKQIIFMIVNKYILASFFLVEKYILASILYENLKKKILLFYAKFIF